MQAPVTPLELREQALGILMQAQAQREGHVGKLPKTVREENMLIRVREYVLTYFKAGGKFVTTPDVAEKLDCTRRTVNRVLRELCEEGFLTENRKNARTIRYEPAIGSFN